MLITDAQNPLAALNERAVDEYTKRLGKGLEGQLVRVDNTGAYLYLPHEDSLPRGFTVVSKASWKLIVDGDRPSLAALLEMLRD